MAAGESVRSARTRRAGVTLLEILIASSILATLIGVTLTFMHGQATLGRQQQTRAFGQAEAQRVHNSVAEILRSGVVIVAESQLCTNALTHHFARIKLHMIDRADPFLPNPDPDDPLRFKLNVIETQRGIIEVLDSSGVPVAMTYDASVTGNAPGRIRFGIDTNDDDVPDALIRDLASGVMRFRVIDQGTAQETRFLLDISFKLRTGNASGAGVADVESTGTTGQVLASKYDPDKME